MTCPQLKTSPGNDPSLSRGGGRGRSGVEKRGRKRRRQTYRFSMEETFSSRKLEPVLALGSGVWDSGTLSTVSNVWPRVMAFPSETLTESREDEVTGLSVYKQQVLESGPNSSSTHCRNWRADSGILWPGEEGEGATGGGGVHGRPRA